MENSQEYLIELIAKLSSELSELKTIILENKQCPELRRLWLPKREVMDFLGYGETQMIAIAKTYQIVASQVGKRTFYNTDSLKKILEESKKEIYKI